jgi:hypothetical protein
MNEEIKSGLKPGIACSHAVQNILSSRLLSKNVKVKIIKDYNFTSYLYNWETVLRRKLRLCVFENRVLRRIFDLKRRK